MCDMNVISACRGRKVEETSRAACLPWPEKEYVRNPQGLHEEIANFYQYMKPWESEKNIRSQILEPVTRIVVNRWPDVVVWYFGSASLELCLPTSDLDLMMYEEWKGSPLFAVAEELRNGDIALDDSFVVLDRIRVPIVKFTDRQTLVKVEITFNGRVACDIQKLYQIFMAWYPQLLVLLLIIKQLLTVPELNKKNSGGMSSFILVHLLVSFFHCQGKGIHQKTSIIKGKTKNTKSSQLIYRTGITLNFGTSMNEGTSVTRHRRWDLSTKKTKGHQTS